MKNMTGTSARNSQVPANPTTLLDDLIGNEKLLCAYFLHNKHNGEWQARGLKRRTITEEVKNCNSILVRSLQVALHLVERIDLSANFSSFTYAFSWLLHFCDAYRLFTRYSADVPGNRLSITLGGIKTHAISSGSSLPFTIIFSLYIIHLCCTFCCSPTCHLHIITLIF